MRPRTLKTKLSAGALILAVAGVVGTMLWTVPDAWGKTSVIAYVANSASNNVQILDLETGQTLNTLYTGTAPWRLVPSPDGKRLMVQNWYSATTSVVNVSTNRVEAVLPSRGPGVFTPKGDRFVTYSWPGAFRETYSVKSLARVEQRQTEDRMVYDLQFWGKDRLFFGQFDPVSKSGRTVFDYVGVTALAPEASGSASVRTGTSPAKLVVDPTGEFLLTANVDDRDVTIVNEHGATARITLGPGPRDVMFADGGKRLIALCWAKNSRVSEIFTLGVDLKARPWPTFEAYKTLRVPAGFVAGAMAPDGRRFYALDRLGNRLVVFDANTLDELQSLAVGEQPSALVLRTVSARERARLTQKTEARVQLEKIIAQIKSRGTSFRDVSFIETSTHEVLDDAKDAAKEGDGADKPATKTVKATTKTMIRLPDSARYDLDDGAVRLAQGGRAVYINKEGRFVETPRQDLLHVLYSVYGLPGDEVVRQLAGDVPGSPWLRNGIAVDVVRTVEEDGHRYHAIGAMGAHDKVSQLWVSAETGLPVSLVEQFPVMRPDNPHGEEGGFSGLTETRLRYAKQKGGQVVPVRLSRYIDGKEAGVVDVTEIAFDQNLSPDRFDLIRLGNVIKPTSKKPATARVSADIGPGVPVVGLGHDHIDSPLSDHIAYNSNPPTSGPHTPYIAEWGVHTVPIPPETQVHNLEDGGVLIQYSCPTPCPDLVRALERASEWHERVIVSPYPAMEHRIALTAWERIQILDAFDEERVTAFIDAYAGKDHHPKAGEGSPSASAQ